MKRLDYLDRAKGILIILVVIGHIWQDGYVHNFIYNFHMPAFFVISGVLMGYTKSYRKNFWAFFCSRVYSLGIPFLFIELLGCLTDIIRNGVTLNIKGYLFNTLTLNFNDHNLWFIFVLFWIEILFVLFRKVLKKDILILMAGAALLAVSLVIPKGNQYDVMARQICYYSFFFAVGLCGAELLNRKNRFFVMISWIAAAVISVLLGKRTEPGLSVKNVILLISALLGTYGVIQLGSLRFPEWADRFLTSAGKNTIIIYGTHHIIYAIVGVLLGVTDYGATPFWAGLVMLAAVAVLEIPIICVINRWLPFLAGKRYPKKEKTA